MENVNWEGVYNLGKGAAQVYGQNPGLAALQNKFDQYQQQKIKDDEDFGRNLARVNFRGAREADLPELNNQYQDILATHAKLRATNNPQQRAILNGQLQAQMQQAIYDGAKSAENQKDYLKFADIRNNPNANLSDEYYTNMNNLTKLPSIGDDAANYNDAVSKAAKNIFYKPVDTFKAGYDVFKNLMDKKVSSGKATYDQTTGKWYIPQNTTTSEDFDAYKNGLISKLSDPKELKGLMIRYNTPDPQDALNRAVNDTWQNFQSKLGTSTKHSGEFLTYPQLVDMMKQRAVINQQMGTQPTPFQSRYLLPMINGGQQELDNFASLADKGQFRPGEGIHPTIVNGYHVFNVDDQVELDKKAVKHNEQLRAEYDKSPDKTGGILGFGGTKVPFEQSDYYKQNYEDPYKVIHKAEQITLNPQDPVDYASKVAELAKRLKIPVSEINSVAGGKGGHGTVVPSGIPQKNTPQQHQKKSDEMIQVKLPNGQTGSVPLSKWFDFRKKYPDAQRVQ